MPRLPRPPRADDSDADADAPPPSPGSYGFPLLLVLIICAAYLWYRRKHRVSGREFSLRHLTNRAAPAPIRLSTDDLPPTHEFLSNNASTDSLPADVELPTVVPQHPAHQSQSTSPIPSFTPSSTVPHAGGARTGYEIPSREGMMTMTRTGSASSRVRIMERAAGRQEPGTCLG
ncbi:hypothetical protein EHS25_001173 [Saitozyma podzolica]|uniref:Uncharacterized protein n=1 Tax=Saitozyma podzolica TaxID=1890683 RepID=A0A427YHK6_9TREE|nr:hypothetical protein EHS25_001173 [Saitozyma podzolica]